MWEVTILNKVVRQGFIEGLVMQPSEGTAFQVEGTVIGRRLLGMFKNSSVVNMA